MEKRIGPIRTTVDAQNLLIDWFCIVPLLVVVILFECLFYMYNVILNDNVKQRAFTLLDLIL